jgi:hypothetical protein
MISGKLGQTRTAAPRPSPAGSTLHRGAAATAAVGPWNCAMAIPASRPSTSSPGANALNPRIETVTCCSRSSSDWPGGNHPVFAIARIRALLNRSVREPPPARSGVSGPSVQEYRHRHRRGDLMRTLRFLGHGHLYIRLSPPVGHQLVKLSTHSRHQYVPWNQI